jgi:hypothetical protein
MRHKILPLPSESQRARACGAARDTGSRYQSAPPRPRHGPFAYGVESGHSANRSGPVGTMVDGKQGRVRRPEAATGQLNQAVINRKDAMDAEKDQLQPPELRSPNGERFACARGRSVLCGHRASAVPVCALRLNRHSKVIRAAASVTCPEPASQPEKHFGDGEFRIESRGACGFGNPRYS